MREKRFPGVAQAVAPVCLGTAQFGDSTGESQAFAVLDGYAAAGGNFIDTANCYGKWLPAGENVSEQILGRWLRSRGGRHSMVISTKGGHPPFSDMHASRLHEREVRADLEESLAALGVDEVEIYWLHRDDPAQPAGALVELLETLRREGRILAYGVSNWSTARFAEAAQYAADHGYTGFCGLQNQWSLARVNREQIADQTLACMDGAAYRLLLERRGSLGAMAFSAMGKGYFSRAAAGRLAPGALREYRNPLNEKRLAALQSIARERGVSVAALVLAWMACKPMDAVPIASVSSAAHLQELTESFDLALTAEELERLDAGEAF